MNIKFLLIAFFTTLTFTSAIHVQAIDITGLQWRVNGDDISNWGGSDLYFLTQVSNGNGYDLTGYFDWRSGGAYRGTELFTGTLSSSLDLHLTGYELIDPKFILKGVYDAHLSADGYHITDGTWHALAGGSEGVWTASVVPEPTTWILVMVSAITFALLRC